MIVGTVSFSHAPDPSFSEKTGRWNASEELVCHPVAGGSFSGAYFAHASLPYTASDFYYCDEAGEIQVLLSGSIYNSHELTRLCGIKDPVPDPELIAMLFRLEGPVFVKKLNGDFAIFVCLPKKKQAFLFRDHVGIRPLAYITTGQALSFSSDVNGLCRFFSQGNVIDSEFLLGYFRFTDFRRTPDGKTKKLLPGHFLNFSASGTEITRYWEPETIYPDRELQYKEMLSDLRDIVTDAVRIRCDKRFTAGAHVSSGLDSGIVSALARKEYSHQESFYGFSWSPADYIPGKVKYDERKIVISSSEKTGIRPLFSDMNGEYFRRIVSAFYDNKGFFSESKALEQEKGVNTNLIFSGWGGDEFISTGDRGIETDLLTGLQWRSFFRRNPVGRPKRFIRSLLHYVVLPALGMRDRATAAAYRNDARYIKKTFRRNDKRAYRDFYSHTSRRQLHLRLLSCYHLQERCESWSISGYRKGVEYRYPLLDKRIIEYMLKIPSELLCRSDHFRPLLREISEGVVPEEVRWQWHKSDPVYWAFMEELFKESAIMFMEEVSEWRKNPDLHFVDFDLLTEDILKYKADNEAVNSKALYRSLVYLKAIHEFTITYRET